MTEAETLRRGVIAASLLDAPEYMEFYEAEKQLLLQCIANTSPEHTTERERLYYMHRAIDQIIAHMQQCRATADELIANREQADEGTSPEESTFD